MFLEHLSETRSQYTVIPSTDKSSYKKNVLFKKLNNETKSRIVKEENYCLQNKEN